MIVTDHALVRWLTRAHGIDMEDMRRQLAALAEPYALAGVKHAFVGGVWFVFDGDRLITVQDGKPRPDQTFLNDRNSVNGSGDKFRGSPHAAKRHKIRGRKRRK